MTMTVSVREQDLPPEAEREGRPGDDPGDDTPVRARWLLDILATKWTPIVLHLLNEQSPMRSGELRRSVPGVSQKVLTTTLRNLERDGLVMRQNYLETPLRVEYRITELGASLIPIIFSLEAWAEENIAEVLARRTLHGGVGQVRLPGRTPASTTAWTA
ncbi:MULTISPECIES: helix-turn-helix domain-containing protein [unclassified Streptomyces]|uniref:winged helix-turn-helix transcriptional regulator n=1 Tax=unclassified Streptomyces TaxID=2593676 RepID=UPI0033BA2D9A